MNRYFAATLAIAAGALVVIFTTTVVLFSRSLREARADSEERMALIGEYVLAGISERAGERRDSEEVGEWLEDLSRSMRLERIVVADSLGLVHWSGNPLIVAGDDIGPYLTDTSLFARALAGGGALVSEPVRIEGVTFQSLYYPGLAWGERFVVVADFDRTVFAQSQRFLGSMVAITALFVALLVLLVAALVVVDRRAAAARVLAARNERLAFLGRMSAELAHELKNPLAIMKSSVDILRKVPDPGSGRQALEFLSDEIMRLSRLIGEILGFSKEKKMRREWIRLSTEVAAYGASRAHVLGSVTVRSDIGDRVEVCGDRDSLVNILDNLTRNAVTAMGGAGEIGIVFEKSGPTGHLVFRDTGPGVPPSIRESLFDPFVSGSKSGTGLGLAIVRTLCERSGWSIALRGGEAAAFEITFGEGTWRES